MANYNPNKAKRHHCYTITEVGELFSVHKNTVGKWIQEGLFVMDDKKPYLIHGEDLREFLAAYNKKNKASCRVDELYCVRCKSPQKPFGGLVDYVPMTSSQGQLKGVCSCCDTPMNRFISLVKAEALVSKLDIHFVRHQ